MTFDDDFARVHFDNGSRDLVLKSLGVDWPPPEVLDIYGFKYRRSSMSDITDEARAKLDFVCRGAEYFPTIDGENLNS